MLKIFALVLPLGLDTFAISAALGVGGVPQRRRVRVALWLCLFEAGMPLIGLTLGAPLGHAVGGVADYIAIGLLAAFGLYTLIDGPEGEPPPVAGLLDRPGVGVLLLGLSVSLDELAIGFTLGLLRLPVIAVIFLIGVQAFVIAQLGLALGSRVGRRVRAGAERLASIALLALALGLLTQKLLA